MYKALAGVDFERVVYGKPELATYKYADEVIASWMEQTHNDERLPSKIYMTGDNPASDIIGGSCMAGTPACAYRRVPERIKGRSESRQLWRVQ